MKATDAYRKINNSPIKGIVLYYTEQILKMDNVGLGSVIAQIQTGKTPPKANPKYYSSSDVNWFKPSDIGYEKYLEVAGEKFSNIAITEKKATIYPKDTLLLIGIGGGVGRVSILKEEGSSNQQITGITFNEKVCAQYAYYYYLVREDYIKSQAKSMSFPILNQSRIKDLEFRYPSVPEQNEFVKFIDVCWYSFLNNKIPDISSFEISPELKEYALKQFKVIELDDKIRKNIENELTLLSNLNQSILQEAVQGKLTADWREENPNTEPASELLNRIKSEKAQLIKDKKSKKQKALPPISEKEIPFELPAGWVWVYVSDICDIYTGNSINKIEKEAKYKKDQPGFNYIGTKDVEFDMLGINYNTGVIIPHKETLSKFKVAPSKSVLVCIEGGSSGKKIGIIDRKICFGNKLLASVTYLEILGKYIYYYYNSPSFASEFKLQSKGLRGGVSTNSFKQIKIPIPPEKEVSVIIQKVEFLLKKCQSLKQEIKTSEANTQMLMQAVLKEDFDCKKEEVII